MSKWTDLAATEEMDSEGAYPIINVVTNLALSVTGRDVKTLCIGCADGTELGFFKNVEGIDLNDNSLNKCLARGYKVQKMDMHQLDYPDDSFDLVYARDVFEHSDSPIQALSEMARVSKRYVLVCVPDDEWANSDWHFLIPTLKQMIAMGEKVNLNLRTYREFNLVLGSMAVFQHVYIFEKRHED